MTTNKMDRGQLPPEGGWSTDVPDSCSLRTDAERIFYDEHGMWPDDTKAMAYCTCYHSCMDDPRSGCSLSGDWHVHADEPCPVHPDAPGDR